MCLESDFFDGLCECLWAESPILDPCPGLDAMLLFFSLQVWYLWPNIQPGWPSLISIAPRYRLRPSIYY